MARILILDPLQSFIPQDSDMHSTGSVLMIAQDGDNPQIRYMYPIKSSLAAEGDVIGFRFGRSSGFQWLGVCDYENVVFHEEYENKEETAGRVLLEILAEDMESRQIFTYMKSLGISNRTVYRVKKELGIISYKKNKIWMWHLPDGISPLETEAEDGQ